MDTIDRTFDSWYLTTEPIRPSKLDLEHMTRMIKERYHAPRVLILGMTPELIDMASEAGANKIIVMELRILALEAYRKMVSSPFEAKNGDWRIHYPELDRQFELVIGHGPFIFLKFPGEWISTLRVIRNYLTLEGSVIMRNFHVPYAAFDFSRVYTRLTNDLESKSHGLSEEDFTHNFLKTATSVRALAIQGATGKDGTVNQEKLDNLMAFIKEDLCLRFGQRSVWTIMKDEFDYPTAAGYASVRPLAAPLVSQVDETFRAGGLTIEDLTMIGNLPEPGSFSFLTGSYIS